jgi:hypothetical protein
MDKVRDWAQDYLGGDPNSEVMGLANPLEAATPLLGATVWHGTGAPKFNKFRWNKIGSGEGAQAYGYGHYLAGDPRTAVEYFEQLKRDKPERLAYEGKALSDILYRRWLDYAEDGTPITGKMDRPLYETFEGLDRQFRPGMTPEQAILDYRKNLAGLLRHTREGVRRDQRTALVHGMPDSPKYNPDFFLHNQEYLGWKLREIENLRRQGDYTKRLGSKLSILPEEKVGGIIKAEIPDEEINKMLLWDAPLIEQPKRVRDYFSNNRMALEEASRLYPTGSGLYRGASRALSGGGISDFYFKRASEELRNAGIPGIKYLSGMTRGGHNWKSLNPADFNYVSFSDDLPKVLDYYDWNKLKQGGFDWYNAR